MGLNSEMRKVMQWVSRSSRKNSAVPKCTDWCLDIATILPLWKARGPHSYVLAENLPGREREKEREYHWYWSCVGFVIIRYFFPKRSRKSSDLIYPCFIMFVHALEKYLSSQGYLLLLQRNWVWFSAPMLSCSQLHIIPAPWTLGHLCPP